MGSLVNILWTIAVILVVLWLLGFFLIPGLAANGLIHILLVIAVIVIVYNLVTGRRAA